MKVGDRVKILAPWDGDTGHAFEGCTGVVVSKRVVSDDHPWHPWHADVKVDDNGFEFVSFYDVELEVVNETV